MPEEYHVLENIVQLDEAYFKNWCLIMGNNSVLRSWLMTLSTRAIQGAYKPTAFCSRRFSQALSSRLTDQVSTNGLKTTGQ